MKKIFAVAALSLASLTATAERADSLKQAKVDFDDAHIDEVTQTRIFTGNVVLTRGTLLIKADKAVLKESPEGYMTVVLTSVAGKSASFRQKRDGGPDLWTEGQAQRIEYDERTEVVKLFSNAIVKQLEGKRVTSEVNSPFISYDNRSEQANVHNDASGESKPGSGRGTVIIAPRRTTPAAAPAAAPAAQSAGAAKQ
jgi:lipopolysaccharide export system protein LptA